MWYKYIKIHFLISDILNVQGEDSWVSPRNTFKDLAQIFLVSNRNLFFPLRKKYIPTDENKQRENFFLQLQPAVERRVLKCNLIALDTQCAGLSFYWFHCLFPWPSASIVLSAYSFYFYFFDKIILNTCKLFNTKD